MEKYDSILKEKHNIKDLQRKIKELYYSYSGTDLIQHIAKQLGISENEVMVSLEGMSL